MSNLIDGLSFSLFFSYDFEGSDTAERIIRTFMSSGDLVRPVKYGVFGPKKSIKDIGEISVILVESCGSGHGSRSGSLVLERDLTCGYQIQWNKSKEVGFPFIGGHLMFSAYSNHESVRDDFVGLVRALVSQLSPAYGEIRSMATKGWDAPVNLMMRLPDIPPVSIYGTEYIEHFGADRIESAPFLRKERVGSCYWLVASDSFEDSVPDAERLAIRSSLGEKSFMADGRWRYPDGDAPDFDISFSLCN